MLSPLWGLVTLLYVTVWGFQVLPILLGLILGAVAGKGIALRLLRSIGARGEYTVSRQNIIARLVVGLAVSGGSLFLLWSFVSDLSFWHAIVEGGYAMNVTAYAALGASYMAWEVRNGKRILSEGSLGYRMYAVPKNSAGDLIENFCTSCGAALFRDSIFCSSCGIRLP